VFWAPVEGHVDMLELWSRPACTLGLRILEGADEKPTIAQGRYSGALKQELEALEPWWIDNVP
jgi:hypothetical protein